MVAAVPFALAVEAGIAAGLHREPAALRVCLICSALFAGWLLSLRFAYWFFWVSPVIPWIALAATLGACCFLRIQLPGRQEPEASGIAADTEFELAGR